MDNVAFLRVEAVVARSDGMDRTGKRFDDAADEIERLQKEVQRLYDYVNEEAKKHFTKTSLHLQTIRQQAIEIEQFECGIKAMKEGVAVRIMDLENRIVQLQAIVDLLPKRDGLPITPGFDPKDGTAERLGIVFRYTV